MLCLSTLLTQNVNRIRMPPAKPDKPDNPPTPASLHNSSDWGTFRNKLSDAWNELCDGFTALCGTDTSRNIILGAVTTPVLIAVIAGAPIIATYIIGAMAAAAILLAALYMAYCVLS